MTAPEKVLRLGCLVRFNNESTPYRGIFVCDANEQKPEYIFTASCRSKRTLGDTIKHVLLEVELLNPKLEGLPELVTKKVD